MSANDSVYFKEIIEKIKSDRENILNRNTFQQLLILVFVAPSVLHLFVHIFATLAQQYSEDYDDDQLETPDEDPDYLETAATSFSRLTRYASKLNLKHKSLSPPPTPPPTTPFPQDPPTAFNYLDQIEFINVANDVDPKDKKLQIRGNSTDESFRLESAQKEEAPEAQKVQLMERPKAEVPQKVKVEVSPARKGSTQQQQPPRTNLPKNNQNGPKNGSKEAQSNANKPDTASPVNITQTDAKEPRDKDVPVVGPTLEQAKQLRSSLESVATANSRLSDKTAEQPLTLNLDEKSNELKFLMQEGTDGGNLELLKNFGPGIHDGPDDGSDENSVSNPRMCKLLLLATILSESFLAFVAFYFSLQPSAQDAIPGCSGRISNPDVAVGCNILKTCGIGYRGAPLDEKSMKIKDSLHVCPDIQLKVWAGASFALLGIFGLLTAMAIHYKFGEALAFTDTTDFSRYKNTRRRKFTRKKVSSSSMSKFTEALTLDGIRSSSVQSIS